MPVMGTDESGKKQEFHQPGLALGVPGMISEPIKSVMTPASQLDQGQTPRTEDVMPFVENLALGSLGVRASADALVSAGAKAPSTKASIINQPITTSQVPAGFTKADSKVISKWVTGDDHPRYGAAADSSLATSNKFTNTLNKLPTFEGTVYRGIALDQDRVGDVFRPGQEFTLDRHSSATRTPTSATDFMGDIGEQVMLVVDQHSSADLKHSGHDFGENGYDEVVMKKDTKYRVDSVANENVPRDDGVMMPATVVRMTELKPGLINHQRSPASNIAPASGRDFDKAIKLARDNEGNLRYEEMGLAITDPDSKSLVHKVGNDIKGAVSYSLDQNGVEIGHIGSVSPGTGSELVRRVEQIAAENGSPRVFLSSAPHSKGFWQHLGYTEVSPSVFEKKIRSGLINQSDRPNITPASIAREHDLDMATIDRQGLQDAAKPKIVEKVDAFANDVKERFGLQQFSLNIAHGDLGLDGMRVTPDLRNQGVGTTVMKELTDFADANGLRIRLSPATKNDHHGTTSRERLVDFYKRFGFVENKGRNIDHAISDGMYRTPQAPPVATGGGIINSVTQKKD